MRSTTFLASALAVASQATARTAVSQQVFNNIIHYTSYAAASYGDSCPTPPFGSALIQQFSDSATDTQASLFRDSSAQELVLAFRGTSSPKDLDTDLFFTLVPLTATGTSCAACKVHDGFLASYNAVSGAIISAIRSARAANPSYKIVVTGHSLGAGLAAIASSSLSGLGYQVTTYTFGEPRNGNPAWVSYINGQVPASRYFRVTHSTDGVPQIPPTLLGFQHHGTEYFQSQNGAANTPATTYQCPGNEPTDCNAAQDFGDNPINRAHLTYSNTVIGNALHIQACGAKGPFAQP